MIRSFLPLFLLSAWLIPLSHSADRPNIVFILADDLGYGDIEAFGGDDCNVDTPHFDGLCRDGMKFTDAHVTDSVCVPSRTSIMTGKYALRFGEKEKGGPWGFIGLQFPESQFTVADMFRRAGYATGYVGKWHLGTRMTTTDGKTQGPENTDFTRPLKIGVSDFGFEDTFFLPGSLDMFPYAFVRNREWQGSVTTQKGWSAFNRVGPAAEDFVDHEVLSTFCNEADRFIAKQAESEKPFFLFVALTAPHTPTSPEPEFQGKSRIGPYGDFVMNTDACIGRVVESLDEAGISDDTLVMVSSDHGPGHYSGARLEATAFQMKEMEKDGHRANGPWRGYKFSAFEGGNRVPFAAKWPGEVPAGTENDSLIGLHDLFATWAEISGAKLSASEAPDSISFLKQLRDPDAAPARESMVIRGTRGNVYRKGKWKLLLCPGSGSAGRFATLPDSDQAWRAAIKSFGRNPKDHTELEQAPFLQLFDLDADPGETTNLASGNKELVAEMIADLRGVFAKGRSTPGPKLENGRELKVFQPVPGFVWSK
ncbi:MAG: arylsulfatase [Verrucomicrobiales bacterium]|nr:arylsulfatase [Verrucomicrobiales bacterium]